MPPYPSTPLATVPECAREEHGILRDDGQVGAEVVHAQRRNVDAVNHNLSLGRLNHTEQRQRHRRFTCNGWIRGLT